MGKAILTRGRVLARARQECAEASFHEAAFDLVEAEGEAERRACSSADLDAPALRGVMSRAKGAATRVQEAEAAVLRAARKYVREMGAS
jgi:hypothetical protein